MPDQLPRARRLAALRTRTLLRAEFGDTDTARSVLSRLVGLLNQLDADEEADAAAAAKSSPEGAPPSEAVGAALSVRLT